MKHSYCIATVDRCLEKKHLDVIFNLLPDGVYLSPACDDDSHCFEIMHQRELSINQTEKRTRLVKSEEYRKLEVELSNWQYRASYKDRGVSYSESFSKQAQQEVDRLTEQLASMVVYEEYEVVIEQLVWEEDEMLCEEWTYRVKKALDEIE